MSTGDLNGRTVFVDTNIFIYAYSRTRYTRSCEEFLNRIRDNDVQGYVNTTVIDELFHKMLIAEIHASKGLSSSQIITLLKREPDIIHEYDLPFTITEEILTDYPITVLNTSPLLKETLGIISKYGLLFSDALHIACCHFYSVDCLFSNDRDFERVNSVRVIRPGVEP